MIILSMLIGFLVGGSVHLQSDYCKCYRDDFNGAFCESIKKDGEQGSCHK